MRGPVELLFPARCVLCQRHGDLVCGACHSSLPLLSGPVCEICGSPTATACRECDGRRLAFRRARSAVGYRRDVARAVLGVDSDPVAVSHLKTAVQNAGLKDRFNVVQGRFSSVSARADVVFFEFCLHEMDDPAEALFHAQSLAPDVLVLDHTPESSWAWYTCEEKKTARSWRAARRLRIVHEASFKATQQFDSYPQFLSKVQVLGEQAITRSRRLSEQEEIRIEMRYALALIRWPATERTAACR